MQKCNSFLSVLPLRKMWDLKNEILCLCDHMGTNHYVLVSQVELFIKKFIVLSDFCLISQTQKFIIIIKSLQMLFHRFPCNLKVGNFMYNILTF